MSEPILTLRNLRIARGARVVIDDVSLTIARGDFVALMGASGAGKTTMLRAIAGLDGFASGEIDVGGVRLAANGPPRGSVRRALHDRVGMVFQFHHLFAHMTAAHNVWLAPVHVKGVPRPEAEDTARALLDALGVGDRADALPHELSGGEAQRVAIARALAVNPPLLLMDEPTASLDASRREGLAATLRDLAGQGRTLLVATHDAAFARSCGRRVVVLESGRIVRDGPSNTVI